MSNVDDAAQDDQKDKPAVAPNLDQVHALSQAKVEEEDANAEVSTGDDDESGADDDGNNDATDDSDKADDTTSTDTKNREEPDDLGTDTEVTKVDKPAVELDIEKNGEGKVAIKSADGKTYYFNGFSEIPEDFEPATYKELMRGVDALRDKRHKDEQAAAEAEKKETEEQHKKATEAMQKSWDADATALVEAGVLPKEAAKLEKAKGEVYDYIEKEMKAGNIITSFKQAYKGMMYDRQQEAEAKRVKELNDAKKKRGAIVQGGSGGSDGDGKPQPRSRVIEAPPTGLSLDAIHNRAINSL